MLPPWEASCDANAFPSSRLFFCLGDLFVEMLVMFTEVLLFPLELSDIYPPVMTTDIWLFPWGSRL